MNYKKTVNMFGLKPEIVAMIPLIGEVVKEIAGRTATITSAVDSKHRTLIHLLGYAVDIRIRDDEAESFWRPSVVDSIIRELRERLPQYYDVVASKNCIHIEFDFRKVSCK